MDIPDDDVFMIMGTHWANTYWNNIYGTAAKQFQEKRFNPPVKDMGEAYYRILEQYTRAIANLDAEKGEGKYYITILTDIYNNYAKLIGVENFIAFKNILVKPFIPADMYDQIGALDNAKDNLLKKIIIQVITQFTIYVNANGINSVINGRDRSQDHLEIWRAKLIEMFKNERTKLRNKFLAQNNGVEVTRESEINTVPKEVADSLQERLKKEIQEKYNLQIKYNKLVDYCDVLKNRLAIQEKMKSTPVTKSIEKVKVSEQKGDNSKRSSQKKSHHKSSQVSQNNQNTKPKMLNDMKFSSNVTPKQVSDIKSSSKKSEPSSTKSHKSDKKETKEIKDATRHIKNVGKIEEVEPEPDKEESEIEGEQLSGSEVSEESESSDDTGEYESPEEDE